MTTKIADIRTAAIPVTDQDRAVSFWVDTLGFEPRMDAPLPDGMRWIEVAPAGATTSLALLKEDGRNGVDTGIRFVSSDADADHAALQSAGVDVDDVLRWGGVPPMFSFRDPDGNTFYLVEQFEG